MFIAITTVRSNLDQFDRMEGFLSKFLPRLERQPGVVAAYHYACPERGEDATLVIWENQPAFRRYREGALNQEVSSFENGLGLPVVRAGYPLAFQALIEAKEKLSPPGMKKPTWSDPLLVGGEFFKVVMENELVRVLEVCSEPGQKAALHAHPDHILYALSDYTTRLTSPDGAAKVSSLQAGQTCWVRAGSHATENIGTTEAHALLIELK